MKDFVLAVECFSPAVIWCGGLVGLEPVALFGGDVGCSRALFPVLIADSTSLVALVTMGVSFGVLFLLWKAVGLLSSLTCLGKGFAWVRGVMLFGTLLLLLLMVAEQGHMGKYVLLLLPAKCTQTSSAANLVNLLCCLIA